MFSANNSDFSRENIKQIIEEKPELAMRRAFSIIHTSVENLPATEANLGKIYNTVEQVLTAYIEQRLLDLFQQPSPFREHYVNEFSLDIIQPLLHDEIVTHKGLQEKVMRTIDKLTTQNNAYAPFVGYDLFYRIAIYSNTPEAIENYLIVAERRAYYPGEGKSADEYLKRDLAVIAKLITKNKPLADKFEASKEKIMVRQGKRINSSRCKSDLRKD